MAAQKRGRKRTSESRAAEIRARLMEWKQIPEPIRISLRALATEIGTSHQLLSFYLRGLDKWQMNESKRRSWEIRERAEAEGRSMTNVEQAQVLAYDRASADAMAECLISKIIGSCLTEVKRGTKLPPIMLSAIRVLAGKGDRKAQEIVEVHENLPHSAPRVAKSFRSV
ncbi:MAG: hypothetical protein LAN84_04155 [Acidobacteriia bacterium]|nr:hypothetical protein [Terriglobia bacterium]